MIGNADPTMPCTYRFSAETQVITSGELALQAGAGGRPTAARGWTVANSEAAWALNAETVADVLSAGAAGHEAGTPWSARSINAARSAWTAANTVPGSAPAALSRFCAAVARA